jgi:hypothetical protein
MVCRADIFVCPAPNIAEARSGQAGMPVLLMNAPDDSVPFTSGVMPQGSCVGEEFVAVASSRCGHEPSGLKAAATCRSGQSDRSNDS